MSTVYTIIHFDYGGHYSNEGEDARWIAKENKIYTLVMKMSMEKITYLKLVERIRKKIMVDEATTKLKLSYLAQVEPRKAAYIEDDEEVLGYLMELNKDHCRGLLHVELIKNVEENQCDDLNTRGSETELRNGQFSIVRDSWRVNDDLMTPYEGEPSKKQEQLENVDNSPYEEPGHIDNSSLCIDFEDTPCQAEDELVNNAWEDGMGISVGQEFGNKEAVQDLIFRASYENSFEVAIVKSDPKLFLLKCREAEGGCKWHLRVAKLKNSDCFTVRTHNKMHTCARVTTSMNVAKRRCTPRLVASIVQEVYPGHVGTPTAKNLIDIVQEKVGVKVSYATALRGRKLAADEYHRSLVIGESNGIDEKESTHNTSSEKIPTEPS